jgi:LPXTG-motif cell wall-anchored protein
MTPEISRGARIASWALQLATAAILAQTLFFKFTYAPETQWIFGEKLGVGRAGATATGIVELVCVILLLVPRTAALGALLSLGTMGGAIASHLAILGIESRNPQTGEGDGGALFALAIGVALMSLAIAFLRRGELRLFVAAVRARRSMA